MSLIKADKKTAIVDKCQVSLWETLKELESYSVLFSNLHGNEIDGESLYGIGIHLKSMSQRLDGVNELLSKLVERDKSD